jgi:hypothetical protein
MPRSWIMELLVLIIITWTWEHLIGPTVDIFTYWRNISFLGSGSRRIAVIGNFETHESHSFNSQGKWHIWPFKLHASFSFFSLANFVKPSPACSAVEVEVALRLTFSQSVSQSVCLGIEHPCGTCDQILLPVGMFLSEICCLVSVGRPLWREDGSAICSVITQWSESLRNHILLSHLRLPPTWRARFPYLYPPGTGWPLYPRALGSLYVACYYTLGYDGGILTLPPYQERQVPVYIAFRNRMVQSMVKSMSKSLVSCWTSWHCMQLEGSLLFSQEPVTCLCPKP